jgi:hypothetical protein
MPRKPSQRQREAYDIHQDLIWSVEAFWHDGDLDSPPSHYVLDEELYTNLLRFLRLAAGRAYPRHFNPKHSRNLQKGTNMRQLDRYEALCREFAERGAKGAAQRALEVMAKSEKLRGALEKALHRERKQRERSQALLRNALS